MDDQHEWYSFEDPNEDRTWLFDVTFLLSNWTCIWGAGCQGVLTGPAEELNQGCCSYGAHLRDDADYKRVKRYAKRLKPEQWQFHEVAKKKGSFAILQKNGDWRTRSSATRIFLNRPGFAGGEGCALHGAASTAGERFIDWKPEVCWQLPIRQVDSTDESGHVTSTVREWKRRDGARAGSGSTGGEPTRRMRSWRRSPSTSRRPTSCARPSATRSTRRWPSTSTSDASARRTSRIRRYGAAS
jgi:hypothetical protein